MIPVRHSPISARAKWSASAAAGRSSTAARRGADYLAPAEANAPLRQRLRRLDAKRAAAVSGFVAIAPHDRRALARRSSSLSDFRLKPDFRLAYALACCWRSIVSARPTASRIPALYDHFLPFRALRDPGADGTLRRLLRSRFLPATASRGSPAVPRRRTMRRAVFVTAGVLMLAEYVSKPIPLATIRTTRAGGVRGYRPRSRRRPDGGAVRVSARHRRTTRPYLYCSTFHWQNLVNSYSGFFPPSPIRLMDAMQTFPDDRSIEALRSRGTRTSWSTVSGYMAIDMRR